MKAVVQRVKRASVSVAGEDVGKIGPGLLALVGFGKTDNDEILQWMANKIASLRVFPDEEGRMSLGLDAIDGEILGAIGLRDTVHIRSQSDHRAARAPPCGPRARHSGDAQFDFEAVVPQ